MHRPLYDSSTELFHLVGKGDEGAFKEVFHFYGQRIYPYLLRKVQSEAIARDMVQDVFFKLWLHKEALLDIDHGEAYLYKIAANVLHDYFRKLGHEQKIKAWAKGEGLQSERVENEVWFSETRKLLEEATHQLSPRCKLIYELRQEGYSYEDIATRLGLSLNTVKNQLVIAGKAIRVFLRDKGLSVLLILL